MNQENRPALFLDRDGVIIQNRSDYVRTWTQVEIFPWALEVLASLKASHYCIVIVSNQSAIGRGLVSANKVDEINRRLVELIQAAGGRIDGVYICPHTPEDKCTCRKPNPGLLYQAAEELRLDLGKSILVGDALEDIEAGRRAGLEKTALVRTGRGNVQLRRPEVSNLEPLLVFDRFDQTLVIDMILQAGTLFAQKL